MPGRGDRLARPIGALLANVADGRDAAPGDLQEVLDVAAALQADADKSDADRLDRRGGKGCRGRLRGGIGRGRPKRSAGDTGGDAGFQEFASGEGIHRHPTLRRRRRPARIVSRLGLRHRALRSPPPAARRTDAIDLMTVLKDRRSSGSIECRIAATARDSRRYRPSTPTRGQRGVPRTFSISGATIRHGPHQAAQKSTTIGTEAFATTASKSCVLVTSMGSFGCGRSAWHLAHRVARSRPS